MFKCSKKGGGAAAATAGGPPPGRGRFPTTAGPPKPPADKFETLAAAHGALEKATHDANIHVAHEGLNEAIRYAQAPPSVAAQSEIEDLKYLRTPSNP